MTWSVAVATPPSEEPVDLSAAKRFLRVDTSDDDGLIADLLAAARALAERITRRAFVSRTLVLGMDAFPLLDAPIALPSPPLVSVSQVQYLDTAGATQTWSSTNWRVDTASIPGRLVPVYDVDWPSTRAEIRAVTITYIAGYGTAEDVPPDIRLAIQHMAAADYELRGASGTVPSRARALLTPYVVPAVMELA